MMKKDDYIKNYDGAERRYYVPTIELRAEGDEEGVVEGSAAVVNKSADIGWFEERIERGAFDDVLEDDVVALFNHDPNLPLARMSAKGDGKLELFLNENGDLMYRFKPLDTSAGRDLMVNLKAGVIKHSSFAFSVKEDKWEYASKENNLTKDRRTIIKVERLYDVSPVTYPAYTDTTVAARSKENLEKEARNESAEITKTKHAIMKAKNKIKTGTIN